MQVITQIESHIRANSKYDLESINKKLNVINFPSNNLRIQDVLNDIDLDVSGIPYSYYQIYDKVIRPTDSTDNITKILIDRVTEKIELYNKLLADNKLDYAKYIQIWKDYNNFQSKLYNFCKIYADFLVNKDLKTNNFDYSLLKFISASIYYKKLFENYIDNIAEISFKTDSGISITLSNVEEFIEYIKSIRSALLTTGICKLDNAKIISIVKDNLRDVRIINVLSGYLHTLLMTIGENHDDMDSINKNEKTSLQKIMSVVGIFKNYIKTDIFYKIHLKYLRARLLDISYRNYELEMHINKSLEGFLSVKQTKDITSMITDIIKSNSFSNLFKNIHIDIKSEKYQGMKFNTSAIKPVLLQKSTWAIPNEAKIDIIYPLEISGYLELIEKAFKNKHEDKSLEFATSVGYIEIDINIGDKTTIAECTIIQAVVLINLINSRKKYLSINRLVTATNIPRDLMAVILDSLLDENIIEEKNSKYKFNSQYIIDSTRVNLINNFAESLAESNIDE